MLKLTDDGAKITLQGRPAALDNRLFWFGAALLIGAVLVAIAMSLLPVRWSIGALALLIVGSFIFNQQRQKHKQAISGHINSGILWIRDGELVHDNQGKRAHIHLLEGDTIILNDKQLYIKDSSEVAKYQIGGFDNEQEARAAKAILQGQTLNKRQVTIKMNGD